MVARLTDTSLSSDLKKGLKQLYFIAGNDSFLISNCLRLIGEAVDGETVKMDFVESELDAVEEQLSTYSFGNKFLVINNFKASDYTGDRKNVYNELLPEISSMLTVAFVLNSEDERFKLPKTAENIAALVPDSAVVMCLKKDRDHLYPYIKRLAERAGAEIGGEAASVLIDLCGFDLQTLSTQIEKLAAASGYKEISEQLIRRMCPRTTEESVFSFLRAVERGAGKEAVKLLNEMLETDNEPIRVLAAIAGSYTNIARIKAANAAGISRARLEEDFGYRKDDRALSVAYSNERRYSQDQMDRIMELLNDTDVKLKSSAVDKRIILEEAMIKLTLLASRRY